MGVIAAAVLASAAEVLILATALCCSPRWRRTASPALIPEICS